MPTENPSSLDCHFTDSPLMVAMGQVTFTQSPELLANVGKLKDEFARLGLPAAEQKQQTTFTASSSGSPPAVNQSVAWTFSNEMRTRVVVLTANALAVYDADYERFSEFDNLTHGLINSVAEVGGPGCLITTAGLRYVSAFKVDALPTSLLTSGISGLSPGAFATDHFHHEYRFWCDVTEGGRLNVIVKTVHEREVFPKDIANINLTYRSKFAFKKPGDGDAVHIDIHEFIQKKPMQRINTAYVSDTFNRMRRNAKRAFLTVTTPEAHKLWGIH